MSSNTFSIQPFEGQRVRFESHLSFAEVQQNLRKLVGSGNPQATSEQEIQQATVDNLSTALNVKGMNTEDFEKTLQARAGESGFILFLEIDHGKWLPTFGIQRKIVRWILGNPALAITMMRHDITAGLFAPVELLLFENASGNGSTIIYTLPSSLMVIEPNPALLEAAQVLDQKLQALVSSATGTEN